MQPAQPSPQRRAERKPGIMGIHVLHRTQIVPVSRARCWEFFSNPRNLAAITPPSLDFQIRSALPAQIRAGLMVQYQVRPLLRWPVTWLTEITQVRDVRG